MSQTIRATIGFFTAAALLVLIAICTSPAARAAEGLEVRTISSRPDTVSGGDVLVEVSTPDHPRWIARLNGRDVTSSFRPAASSDRHIARLTGLEPGKNILEIRVGNRIRSKLELFNHARFGPMFSGPHQQPFICQTETNGLGSALDSNCSARTIVQYYYRSTEPDRGSPLQALTATFGAAPGTLGPGFKAYDPSSPPSDVAQTTTADGRKVRYVVRREVGTINRAVYEIQFLHEPGQPLPTPWTSPTPGWNGRLVYVFGGGCGAGYHQGTLPGPVGTAQRFLLARGYAVAASTLNVFGHNCNDRISAETVSMVKEHFIEQFGVPVHTIGQGPSGGSMQVHLIAQNYPGLLDGIIASVSYPDVVTTATSFTDCALLDHAFETSTGDWSEDQKTAVSGFATWRTCKEGWKIPLIDARSCDALIPKEMVYDRLKNPQGVRCDIYSNEVNVLGRNPRTGLARRPLDNAGVQYGLIAFNEGRINAEQFLELNERIGGYDADGNIVATRTEAELDALHVAYQQGLVLTGGGGLPEIPIIDWRPYLDHLGDGHDSFRSFATRARLIAANGHANNHVSVVGPPQNSMMRYLFPDATTLQDERERDLLQSMDRWLDNIAADRTSATPSEKVSRNKPIDLKDGCWLVSGERVAERGSYDGKGRCHQAYPPHGDARIAAGAPVADDILKCSLKPIRAEDYAQPLSADQTQRLKALFPKGVCDYSRPGVGQQVTRSTWQKYGSEDVRADSAARKVEQGNFDPLQGLAKVEEKCQPSHIGSFGDVTTVTLDHKIIYRNGRGPWRTVPIELKGAHSVARLPNGAWLVNDTGNDQMVLLQDLEGHGSTVTRSELGGFALFRPHDQIVDPETGYIYVVDGNRRLFRFRDLNGAIDVWTFPADQLGYIRGMSWFDGRLHLADATRGEVHRIDDFDKRMKTTFRSPSPPSPQDPPIPDRNRGGGSLSATGLVLNDVEKAGDWYYGTNYFAPSHAQGGDPRPARIIRWRSWDDFERGEWQDLTRLLPDSEEPLIAYSIAVRGSAVLFTLINVAQPSSGKPHSYKCFLRLDVRDIDTRTGE